MKKVFVFALGCAMVVMTAGSLFAHGDEEHEGMKMEKGTQEFSGEVIDLTCYLSHPDNGRGKKHAKCAANCIKSGLPVGLLTDHGLALLVGDEHKPLNKKLAPLAAKKITVHGTMHMKDGMMLISVSHIGEKAGSTTQSTK